jgi:hypothetical protein
MGYESAVILVTVLSTISVCAVVLSIINVFGKLGGKVDVIYLMKTTID